MTDNKPKFSEKFPELKAFQQHYMADVIEKHCISKQRVREAIDSIHEVWTENEDKSPDYVAIVISDIKVYLEEELGL